jgi:predicted nucleotidyltransferase component of viral defense system
MQTPNSVRHLDNAIRGIAEIENYMSARTLIANAILAHLLPSGVIKGGSSLKLRYGDRATRFTTDLDAARTIEIEQFITDLSASLEKG